MPSDTVADDAVGSSGQWTVEVTQGPNKGAIVKMEPGSLRIGSSTDNDIVLADGEMAGEQVMLELSEGVAEMAALSDGMTVDGAEMGSGETVALQDGMVVHAGTTTFAVHGPRRKRLRWAWLLGVPPVILLLVGGVALLGHRSPTPAPVQPRMAVLPVPPPAEGARRALMARLTDAGLADRIVLREAAGSVIAEGALPAADMPRWSEQQIWFDGQYHGSLSLVNQVAPAAVDDMPAIHLRAVSAGATPYIITENGDRFVEGAVVDGWTIEAIAQDKVVFSKNGHRVEEGL